MATRLNKHYYYYYYYYYYSLSTNTPSEFRFYSVLLFPSAILCNKINSSEAFRATVLEVSKSLRRNAKLSRMHQRVLLGAFSVVGPIV